MKKTLELSQAKQDWINTMKRSYPDFNHKKWGRNSSYRMAHPQAAILD